jgi:pimeloyl-ACP methyl ester carboxylesterase
MTPPFPWSMPVSTAYGAGQYHPALSGDHHYAVVPRGFKSGSKPPVIWCPGHGAAADQGYAENYTADVARAICAAGYPLLCIDAGASVQPQWGNATALACIDDAIAYAQSTLGAATGKAHVMGFSMGGLAALAYATANPSKVRSVLLVCPGVDMDYYYSHGFADTATAYGSFSAMEAALPLHSPQQIAANGNLPNVPIKMFYTTDDTTAVTALQLTFASTAGAAVQVESMGTGGHSPLPLSPSDAVAFLNAN